MIVRFLAVLACLLAPTLAATASPRPTTDRQEEQIQVAGLIRTLSRDGATAAELTVAEKALATLGPAAVLPAVLAELERLQADSGVAWCSLAGSGFQEPRTAAARTARTLWRVWYAQTHAGTREQRAVCGVALFGMLSTATTDLRSQAVISAINDNFVPEAEAPLATLLKNRLSREHRTVAEILLRHRTRAHADAVIDVIADPQVIAEARGWYLMMFCGPAARAIDVPTRKRLVAAGFSLSAQNQSLQTASHLSEFVNVRFDRANGFLAVGGAVAIMLPNTYPSVQKMELANALAWWAEHEKDYAGEAPPAP